MTQSARNNRERQTARALASTQGVSYQRALQRLRSRRGSPNPMAEERVDELLASIAGHRWLNLHVPHGFECAAIFSEECPNVFSPVLGHVRVDACLTLPVVYTAKNGRAHKASHSNLSGLRSWLGQDARAQGITLVGWEVKPDEDPEPKGDPHGPDQTWRVLATFEDPWSYGPARSLAQAV